MVHYDVTKKNIILKAEVSKSSMAKNPAGFSVLQVEKHFHVETFTL